MTAFTINPEGITSDRGEKIHLYSVCIWSPAGVACHFVLAPTPEDACGQARCVANLSTYQIPPELNDLVKAHAIQVPLAVGGWGEQAF